MSDTLRTKAEAAEAKLFRLEMRCPTCGSDKFGGDGDTRIKCHGHCEQESTYAKWEAHAVCVLRSGVDVDAVLQAALREVVLEIADLGFPWYTDFYGDCDDCGAAPSWAVGGGTHKPGCDLDIPNKIRAHYGLGK